MAPTRAVAADAKLGRKVGKTVGVAGIGKVAAYTAAIAGGRRYNLVIENAGKRVASPDIDFVETCGMHKCDIPTAVVATARTVIVDGLPAATLELRATFDRIVTDPDTGKRTRTRTWGQQVFVMCTTDSCMIADVGGPDESCNATLSDTAELTWRCPTSATLSFDNPIVP
jgi:hypothetical protein